MRQMQQIKGFGKQDTAHLDPVDSIKQLQEKQPKHYTLIERCLKSLVKQKLSGCLINFERKKRQSEQRSQSNKKSNQDLYGYLNDSIKKRRYVNPELKSLFPDENSSNQTRIPSTMMSIHERISKLSQKNKDRYRAINQTQPILQKVKQDLNQHRLSQIRKRAEISFISSVQIQQSQRQRKKGLNTSPQGYNPELSSQNRLPRLENRASVSISPSQVIKNVKKSPNYNINQEFWRYLTNESEVTLRKRKNSTTSDINITLSLNHSAKQVKSSLFKPTVPSVSRENLLTYINSLPSPFRRLIQFAISFFNIKIQNQVSALFYSRMLEQLNLVNNRAWSVVGFIFWDFNRDGTINSKDLFSIFKQFNQFQQNQTQLNKKLQKVQKLSSQKTQSNRKNGRLHRKQNQIHVQIQSNIKQMERALKKYKPEFEKEREKEKKLRQKQFQHYKKFQNGTLIIDDIDKKPCFRLKNVLKAIQIFKSQLLRLNARVSSSSYTQIDIEQLKEPQEKLVSYLEEIVLTQPNLKYEQIQPLFSAGGNNNDSHEHKLQLFPKDLNVKCSSSYKQCFVSTEHNEETRLLRQKIQNYKLKLKEKRSNKNAILRQKIQKNLKLQKQLSYVKAAQSSMGQVVKDILFNLLGYEE